jgi:glycerophosphoryl diester phosphodiesterase
MDWLTARPVAHRGLHDAQAGVIENTPSAFRAAIAGNYAIECDLQISADGEAIVHHDDALGRLTEGNSPLASLSAADIKRVRFKSTADAMLTLGELCDLTAGRVTLLLELKSRFDGDHRLADRTAKILAGYKGPVAVMSFDPGPLAAIRNMNASLTRGLVAQKRERNAGTDHDQIGAHGGRYAMQALVARLQFLAYRVKDLPSAVPLLAHNALRLPLLTWTVRTPDDRARAARWADQMIFEGFRP